MAMSVAKASQWESAEVSVSAVVIADRFLVAEAVIAGLVEKVTFGERD
jgi:hypothetical protein